MAAMPYRSFLALCLFVNICSGESLLKFRDVTQEAGILWTHQNGQTGKKFLIETMGGGGAFLDYDQDGLLDIYLVNSGSHARSNHDLSSQNALYKNNPDGTFTEVTKEAGVSGSGYGMGVAVGDYDNDGWTDIYVTGFGRNILYRNQNDGSFLDVTASAGVAVDLWSTSAAFFDQDNDGDLDLFVCVYLEWDFDKNVHCGEEGHRSYCHPDFFNPIASVLFRNNGDGTFTDISRSAGVDLPGKALGVVSGDVNGDSYADLYVANDAVANFLFMNQGDGTFKETGLLAEVAYGIAARPESGMGTDFGDFDGDGRLDLVVTNIDNEMNNLYANQGSGYFTDRTIPSGAGHVGLLQSGFGVRFVDYDNDGDLDLTILNGHVLDNIGHYKSAVEYAEKPLLLENRDGRFASMGGKAGEIWSRKLVGRALAVGDYDNDGDSDLLFVNNNEPVVLLRNDGGNQSAWLGLSLIGSSSNRDAVGAVVRLKTNRREIVRQLHGGGSYQAGHDRRLIFGLQADEKMEEIRVSWPSGGSQKLPPLELRRYHTVVEPR